MSTLTGESVPVDRGRPTPATARVPLLEARDLVFSGTTARRRGARRVVSATGMQHRARPHRRAVPAGRARGEPAGAPGQAGRLADRAGRGRRGLRVPPARAGWPGCPGRGVQLRDRAARRQRARGAAADDHARAGGRRARAGPPGRAGQAALRGRDARLDHGHLHRQDRHADREPDARHRRSGHRDGESSLERPGAAVRRRRAPGSALAAVAVACSTAELAGGRQPAAGDPTELALLELAAALGAGRVGAAPATSMRPRDCSASTRGCKLMSTVDEAGRRPGRCTPRARPRRSWPAATRIATAPGDRRSPPRDRARRRRGPWTTTPRQGLRVLAVGRPDAAAGAPVPGRARGRRAGPVPPRAGRACSTRRGPRSRPRSGAATRPGIRIIVVTGDHGLTAAEIARQVGIGTATDRASSTGAELDAMSDARPRRAARLGRRADLRPQLAGGQAADRRRAARRRATSSR